MSADESNYLRPIDGLRGIAIAVVLFNHSTQLLSGSSAPWPHWLWRMTPGGWQGVDLFFVVSGFLITRILLGARGRQGAFGRFWVRRALRIFPLAWLYLAALVALSFVLPSYASLHEPGLIAAVLFYLTNVRIAWLGWSLPAVTILWSLAVEEHFYTFWPLVALYVPRRRLFFLLCSVILVTPLIRLVLHSVVGTIGVYVLTICRWDALACGAIVALLWTSPLRARVLSWATRLVWPALATAALVLVVPFGPSHARSPLWFEVLGYSMLAVSYAVITLAALAPGGLLGRVLSVEPLAWLGRHCYGLYIWHVLTSEIVWRVDSRLDGMGFVLRGLLWFAVTCVVAMLSYQWFEAPILKLKDRFNQPPPPPASNRSGDPVPAVA